MPILNELPAVRRVICQRQGESKRGWQEGAPRVEEEDENQQEENKK